MGEGPPPVAGRDRTLRMGTLLTSRRLRASCIAAGMVALLAALPAAGQPAAADMLFKEAVKLAEQGKWAEACPKFQASYELDPQLGALMSLADCHVEEG